MVGRQDAGAHQRVQHGQPGALGESTNLCRRPPCAAPGQQDRLLAERELVGDGVGGLGTECRAVDR